MVLPRELLGVEQRLKALSAASTALETLGLEKNEVMRLRNVNSRC